MNFEVTNEILEKINPYIENAVVKTVSEESKDYKGDKYKSDIVIIDKENNIGFEVLENEIIAFYFTDHTHFEDYSSELQSSEDDYQKRAADFLMDLLEKRIKRVNIYKGKKLATDKYYMVPSEGTEEFIGGTYWSLTRSINPFIKKKKK